jgi:hypothetical protein
MSSAASAPRGVPRRAAQSGHGAFFSAQGAGWASASDLRAVGILVGMGVVLLTNQGTLRRYGGEGVPLERHSIPSREVSKPLLRHPFQRSHCLLKSRKIPLLPSWNCRLRCRL